MIAVAHGLVAGVLRETRGQSALPLHSLTSRPTGNTARNFADGAVSGPVPVKHHPPHLVSSSNVAHCTQSPRREALSLLACTMGKNTVITVTL